jgi:hypothetical protein
MTSVLCVLQKEKEAGGGDAANSRKSSRPGKGRNPRLEREDMEVDIPKKVFCSNPGSGVNF